jgi:hypothetical protein
MDAGRQSGGADSAEGALITRTYSGGYEVCRQAMELDASELALKGYRPISESYDVSWGAGVAYGCMTVIFERAPLAAPGTADGPNPKP